MDAKQERRERVKANAELQKLANYHDGLPIAAIDDILGRHGFNPMEPAIYCGRDGQVHEQVGAFSWMSMTWHKMEESGRYEIVAYVS